MNRSLDPEPEVRQHLVVILRALVKLLTRFGEESQAEWLAARLTALEDPASTPKVVAATIDELHEVVLGMRGLTDMYLRGPRRAETEEANDDLQRLADQLFELTR